MIAVIFLFPLVGNILQFLIQDCILQMKNVSTSDYEIVSKYYETVLERESHYQEYNYFSKQVPSRLIQTELSSIDQGTTFSSKY